MQLSIDRSYFVRHFQISRTHVNSSSLDRGHLNLSDQVLRNGIVIKPYESKSPAGFADRISNDLILFNFSVLLEVSFQFYVLHLVIQSTHEHFVANGFVCLVIQLGTFFVMSTLVKHILPLVVFNLTI